MPRELRWWERGAAIALVAGGFALALAGAPTTTTALPMDPPTGPGGALGFGEGPPGLGEGPPGLGEGPPGFGEGPPGLEEGPPGMGNVPSFVNLPVRVERLEGDELLLKITHPRADELGLETPFLTLQLGPLNSPRFARIVPEPGTALLLAGAGAAAFLTRRRRRP